ncbi:MAG TPA: hypothetical protein PKC21_04510 [Oligoflexia bacterium]|nr:hypothetical protein [Oligoflexia bacterium]HMR24600.1 hypothetical protein [Oligoflexia bacterium]
MKITLTVFLSFMFLASCSDQSTFSINTEELDSFEYYSGGGFIPFGFVNHNNITINLKESIITGGIHNSDNTELCSINYALNMDMIHSLIAAIDSANYATEYGPVYSADGPNAYVIVSGQKIYFFTGSTPNQTYYKFINGSGQTMHDLIKTFIENARNETPGCDP